MERKLTAILATDVVGYSRLMEADEAGVIAEVLRHLKELTGVPVVMNTSLNGPGEPIVETPEQAFAFFDRAGIDVLYLDEYRLAR